MSTNLTGFFNLLSDEYSIYLYGKPNCIPLNLEIIWTSVLPFEARRFLLDSKISKSVESTVDFYWLWDTVNNPKKTLYIRRHLNHGHKPLKNNTWYESVHCPALRLPNNYTGGIRSAYWSYVLPGSGVSLNTGRTFVAKSYHHAVYLLHNIFKFKRYKHFLKNYDTIQIVNHVEYHAKASPRHEIIHLHGNETSSFLNTTRCGRQHHFIPCTSHIFKRFEKCGPSKNFF